jgi:chromosome segregation ATPase
MTSTTTADAPHRTTAAIQARRGTTEAMLHRVREALRQMRRERARITVAAVARRAGVSRTFLYQNTDARTLVTDAAAEASGQRVLDQAEQAAHAEAAWRERALNAEDALKHAHTEIALQRNNIAHLLGKIRDLENDLPEDGIQRVVTENTTLKQQARQLTADKRRLEERLTGARDNNRFLDKRIADLEAELADPLLADQPSS